MKNKFLKILLLPFSGIYFLITSFRNRLFDSGLLTSEWFDVPVISLGNLAVGGTGKTPHTEFILSFLKEYFRIAVLSRGYKRKTKGFIMADENATASTIGDEPFQIYNKNRDIFVAVDEKRVHGIRTLLDAHPETDVILLDDAYQHRYVKPGLNILLTAFNHLFTDDWPLPSGRLRESRRGYRRADIIIVTKCPENISKEEMENISVKIKPTSHQQLFFSTYTYLDLKPVFGESEMDLTDVTAILLVTGIVSNSSIVQHFKEKGWNVSVLSYTDHYNFTVQDYEKIALNFEKINAKNKRIVVTEKDAARLFSDHQFPDSLKKYIFAIPIEVSILNNRQNIFTEKVKNYVRKNQRNR